MKVCSFTNHCSFPINNSIKLEISIFTLLKTIDDDLKRLKFLVSLNYSRSSLIFCLFVVFNICVSFLLGMFKITNAGPVKLETNLFRWTILVYRLVFELEIEKSGKYLMFYLAQSREPSYNNHTITKSRS